jgi:hypothetical protein
MKHVKAYEIKFGDRFAMLNEGLRDRTIFTAVGRKQGNIYSLNEFGNKIPDPSTEKKDGFGKTKFSYKKESGVYIIGASIQHGVDGIKLVKKRVPGNVHVKLFFSAGENDVIDEQKGMLSVRDKEILEDIIEPYE